MACVTGLNSSMLTAL